MFRWILGLLLLKRRNISDLPYSIGFKICALSLLTSELTLANYCFKIILFNLKMPQADHWKCHSCLEITFLGYVECSFCQHRRCEVCSLIPVRTSLKYISVPPEQAGNRRNPEEKDNGKQSTSNSGSQMLSL